MRSIRLSRVCAVMALGVQASAQDLSWSVSGTATSFDQSQVMKLAGDVDGDGYDDVIVGNTNASPVMFLDGDARVYSGVDGTVIYTYFGDTLDGLGSDVGGAGDVNQDGHDDFLITSIEEYPVLYSGLDGAPLFTFSAVATLPVGSVAGAGDVNLDGFPDVIVGASSAASGNGRAWVFSGAFMAQGTPPEILYVFEGLPGSSGSGLVVDTAGDVDGDGRADVIVARSSESGMVGPDSYCGIARVYSGVNGALIRAHHGFGACGGFGSSVSGVGDLDGDGHDEVLVGAPFDDTNGSNAGLARVYSGADGQALHTYLGSDAADQLGRSVDGAGDVNGDGVPDYLIGAPIDEGMGGSGTVWLCSGLSGAVLSTISVQGGTFGLFVAGGARFDDDAFADFAVVAPNVAGGELYAFGGVCTGANYPYCTAAPNSASPTGGSITASGSMSLSENDLTLLARECPPNQNGVFFYGLQQQEIPFGDGTLCVGAPFFRIPPIVQINSIGVATLTLDMTAPPIGAGPGMIEPGDTRYASFWFRDPAGGPVGFNYTNGRVLTFCP